MPSLRANSISASVSRSAHDGRSARGSSDTRVDRTRCPSPSSPSASVFSTHTSSNFTMRGAVDVSARRAGHSIPSVVASTSRHTGAAAGFTSATVHRMSGRSAAPVKRAAPFSIYPSASGSASTPTESRSNRAPPSAAGDSATECFHAVSAPVARRRMRATSVRASQTDSAVLRACASSSARRSSPRRFSSSRTITVRSAESPAPPFRSDSDGASQPTRPSRSVNSRSASEPSGESNSAEPSAGALRSSHATTSARKASCSAVYS